MQKRAGKSEQNVNFSSRYARARERPVSPRKNYLRVMNIQWLIMSTYIVQILVRFHFRSPQKVQESDGAMNVIFELSKNAEKCEKLSKQVVGPNFIQ